MSDVIYCPRTDCQNPVIPVRVNLTHFFSFQFQNQLFKDETLAQCQVCNFAFCALCRQGYHGIEPCKITNGNQKKKIILKNKFIFFLKMKSKRFV